MNLVDVTLVNEQGEVLYIHLLKIKTGHLDDRGRAGELSYVI